MHVVFGCFSIWQCMGSIPPHLLNSYNCDVILSDICYFNVCSLHNLASILLIF